MCGPIEGATGTVGSQRCLCTGFVDRGTTRQRVESPDGILGAMVVLAAIVHERTGRPAEYYFVHPDDWAAFAALPIFGAMLSYRNDPNGPMFNGIPVVIDEKAVRGHPLPVGRQKAPV